MKELARVRRPNAPSGLTRQPRSAAVRRLAVAFVIVLVCAFSASLGWSLYVDFRRGIEQAQDTSARLADALAAYSLMFFKVVDANLQGTGEELGSRTATEPVTATTIQQLTRRRLPQGINVQVAWLCPVEGVAGSGAGRIDIVGFLPSGISDIAAVDVYAAHLNGDAGLFVGSPRRDAATGEWFVLLSRRVSDASGAFRGVLVASIPEADLRGFSRSLQIGQSGAATLARSDGVVLARHPVTPQILGVSLAQSSLFAVHLPEAPVGTFRGVAQTDGVERFVSYRRLEGVPVVVAVGIAAADALDDYRDSLRLYALLWGILTAATIVALYTFLRSEAMRGLAETARAKALDRMRQIARRLRVTQDTLAEAIVTFDSSGRIESANKAARQMFGFTVRGTGGRPLWQMVRSTEATAADPMAAFIATAGTMREVVGVRGDGSPFPAELRVSAFELDGRPLYTASLIDVSEQREAARQAQISESRFRAVFDASSQGMALLRPDGVMLEVNAPMLTRTGVPRDLLVGRPAWEAPWWRLVSGGPEWLREAIRKAATGELVQNTFTTIDRMGRPVSVDYVLQPIRNQAGEIVYLLAEGRDITELVPPRDQIPGA